MPFVDFDETTKPHLGGKRRSVRRPAGEPRRGGIDLAWVAKYVRARVAKPLAIPSTRKGMGSGIRPSEDAIVNPWCPDLESPEVRSSEEMRRTARASIQSLLGQVRDQGFDPEKLNFFKRGQMAEVMPLEDQSTAWWHRLLMAFRSCD